MVAVISVDAYAFLAFSDLAYHLEDTGIGVFCLHCAEVVIKKLLHQQVKLLGVVLVSCCTWKCGPTAFSGGVHISEVPGCCSIYLLCC